ncbi:hypothetical protein [Streptomyces ardesiacus]
MTEYTATCNASSRDTITARVADGMSVELEARFSGEYKGEAYLTPTKARTFARGILALADEIDGGEAEEAPALRRIPKVGDRVRVVRSAPGDRGRHEGDVGTLDIVDANDPELTYRVRLTDRTTWWCAEVEPVGDEPADTRPKVGDRFRVTRDFLECADVKVGDIVAVGELTDNASFRTATCADGRRWHFGFSSIGDGLEPLADWERDLIESAEASAPVKVGDRVEIVRGLTAPTDGRAGVVGYIDESDPNWPYRVDDEAGDFIAWAGAVRKVEVTEHTGPEPTPSSFAYYVNEAKALLTGTTHTGADIVALAAELADRG